GDLSRQVRKGSRLARRFFWRLSKRRRSRSRRGHQLGRRRKGQAVRSAAWQRESPGDSWLKSGKIATKRFASASEPASPKVRTGAKTNISLSALTFQFRVAAPT